MGSSFFPSSVYITKNIYILCFISVLSILSILSILGILGILGILMQEMAGKNKGWAPREAGRPPCFVDEAISCMLQFLTPKKQLVRIPRIPRILRIARIVFRS